MKTIIAMVLMVSSVASADVTVGDKPLVLRSASNLYAVPGEGLVSTRNCTVNGGHAVITTERGKGFITFIDSDGEEEGQCQLSKPAPAVAGLKLGFPHRPTVAAVRNNVRAASNK